jgi:hypothetical protein
MRCGVPLAANSPQGFPSQPPVQAPTLPNYAAQYPVEQPLNQPSGPYQPPWPPNYNVPAQAQGSPYYPQQPNYAQSAAPGGASLSLMNVWSPFAGYGTRRRHFGWLMDTCGERANDLVQKVNTKFKERQIPGASISNQVLVGRGVVVENRPYFLLQRGLVTMGLYISQFGRDLYISQVSYLKPPISGFRVALLAVMIGFWLFSVTIFRAMLSDAVSNTLGSFGGGFLGGAQPGSSGLYTMLCVIGPLGTLNSLALFFFLIYSGYKWLTEKDILAGLRTTPNEFNEDDLMAMEKAVEQTVRIALDEIGLNQADLKPIHSGSDRRLI